MRQKLRRVLMGSFLGAAIASLAGQALGEDCMPWQPTIDAARGVAAETDRLVLVHFWATSCGPCKKVERNVFSQPKFAEQLSASFVPVKIDMDATPELGAYFGVNVWPTDVIMTPAGKVLATLRCPPDAQAYLAQINQVATLQRRSAQDGQVQLVQYPQQQQQQYPAQQAQQFPQQQYPPQQAPQQPYAPAAGAGSSMYNSVPPGVAGSSAYGAPAQAQPQNQYQTPYAPQNQQQYAQPGYAQPYSTPGQAPPAAGQQSPAMAYAPGSINPAGTNGSYYAPANQAPAVAQAQSPPAKATPASAQQLIPGSAVQPEQGGLVAALIERRQAAAAKETQQQAAAADAAAANKPNSAGANPVQLPQGSPPLGLDGYCPVTLDQGRWELGDRRWGAIHQGRTYLFKGQEEQQRFLANPDHYSPMLSGNDPVLAVDQNQAVPGSRTYGARTKISKRLYLFASKETQLQFARESARYEATIQQRIAANSPKVR